MTIAHVKVGGRLKSPRQTDFMVSSPTLLEYLEISRSCRMIDGAGDSCITEDVSIIRAPPMYAFITFGIHSMVRR